eukprot:SAG11_NODE_27142_length_336_cov_0.869198_1_plen_54_part_01
MVGRLGERLKVRWQDIMENAVALINESFAAAKWAHTVTEQVRVITRTGRACTVT